jgi:hypothetical protein
MPGDDHDALLIAHEDVAGEDGHPGAGDRHVDVDRVVDDQVEVRGAAGGEDRERVQRHLRRVPDRAVADQSLGSAHS